MLQGVWILHSRAMALKAQGKMQLLIQPDLAPSICFAPTLTFVFVFGKNTLRLFYFAQNAFTCSGEMEMFM